MKDKEVILTGMEEIKTLSFEEKLLLLTEEEKEYLRGFLDCALLTSQKEVSA